MFDTSRQVGRALAVAIFGAILPHGSFMSGLRTSPLIAAVVALLSAAAATALHLARITHGWATAGQAAPQP